MWQLTAFISIAASIQCLSFAEKIGFCDEVSNCFKFSAEDSNSVDKLRDTKLREVVNYDAINTKILKQITEAELRLDAKIARLEFKMSQMSACENVHIPRSCREIQNSESGAPNQNVFNISLATLPRRTDVYCDQETDGGGWIVFQRRMDGSEDFYRGWNDYVNGFGSKEAEFWLGLENIYQIVKRGNHELRVDMEDWEGNRAYAKYGHFSIGDASTNYRLTVGDYSGTAGNALGDWQHQGRPFTTKDADHDIDGGNCANVFHGAFWYGTCHNANLNGLYIKGGASQIRGVAVVWYQWKGHHYSLKSVEMKVREKI